MYFDHLHRFLKLSVALALASFFANSPAVSAEYTWTGGGGDANWTTGDNWGGTAPVGVNTDTIHMAGSTQPAPVVDTNDPWVLNELYFDSGASSFALSGNTLRFGGSAGIIIRNNSSVTQTIDNDIVIGASGSKYVYATSGNVVFDGDIDLTPGSLFFRGTRSVTLSGLISGTGSLGRTDPGTVYITNDNNTFSGNISISHGVFEVASIADAGEVCALGTGSVISLSQAAWGGSDTGTLRYTGPTASTNRTIEMRSNDYSGGPSNPNYDVPSGRPTLEVTNPDTTLTFTGNFQYGSGSFAGRYWQLIGAGNGVIEGNITTTDAGILKTGTGTWTLAGDNTYSGATTISNGTLALRHATSGNPIASSVLIDIAAGAVFDVTGLTGAGGFSLSSGQTLQGNGTMVGNLRTAAGSNLSPGTSPGVLTIQGSFVQDSEATLLVELADNGVAGMDYDLVDVYGDAVLDGWLDVSLLDDFTAEVGDYFDVLTTTGSLDITGLELTGDLPNTVFGWWEATVVGGVDGGILRLTAVPEPSSFLLVLSVSVGCLACMRRRHG